MIFTGKNLRIIEDALWRYVTQPSVLSEDKEIAKKLIEKVEKENSK